MLQLIKGRKVGWLIGGGGPTKNYEPNQLYTSKSTQKFIILSFHQFVIPKMYRV